MIINYNSDNILKDMCKDLVTSSSEMQYDPFGASRGMRVVMLDVIILIIAILFGKKSYDID